MSTIVLGTPEVMADDNRAKEVKYDFGEVSEGTFTLNELCADKSMSRENSLMHTYTLSGDDALRQKATDLVIISIKNTQRPGKLFMLDQVILGDFIMLLSQGGMLKGFHCENCARQFVQFFNESQEGWRYRHHATARGFKDASPKTLH